MIQDSFGLRGKGNGWSQKALLEKFWARGRTFGFDPSHQPALGFGLMVAFALRALVKWRALEQTVFRGS